MQRDEPVLCDGNTLPVEGGSPGRGRKTTKRSRAERNIAWIEKHCRVPEGKLIGQPLVLRLWQRKELVKIYDNPHLTRRAILSFGRKNGKTVLAACLLLLHLVGPEYVPNSQLYSTAQSRDQAAVLFALAAKMVRLSPVLYSALRIRETVKQIYCPELGTLYAALSADAATNLGKSPVFIVHDELGQVKGPRSPLYEALETAVGAHENPLSIIISTQAPTDGDLLSVLIDDALANRDKQVVVGLYTADMKLDPFSEEAIKQANPAYNDFLNPKLVRSMAEDARAMPSREAEYRNLILNQRVEALNSFVTVSVWEKNNAKPASFRVCFGGLDLAEVNDLTALVLVSQKYDVVPTFWLPSDGIVERSRADRVPYDVWAKEGLIELTPGPSVSYEVVALRLVTIFDQYDLRAVAFDRFNMRHLRPWLIKAGLTEAFVDTRFIEFGQGFASMSPAVRTLEELLLQGKLKHGDHPVLKMCATNAVVRQDEAGNRKLDKKRSRGRIDGLTALTMACDVTARSLHERHVYEVPVERIVERVAR